MMNIVFVNTLPIWGGCERWVVQVGSGLQERGHRVTVMSLPGSETESRAREAGLHTFSLALHLDLALWKVPGLMRYFKKNRSDVVVCVQNRDVKVAALSAKMAKVPVVLVRNGLDVIKRKLDHRIAFTRFVDGIITNAKVLRDIYMGYGWFDDDFIHVIYDGLQLPENVKSVDLNGELDFPKGSKLIVSAGRLVEQKGFDYLVEVASIAKKNRKDWRFVVVGTGKLEKQLHQLVAERGVGDYIKFIGFRSNVLPHMAAADLFVLTSRSEGLSSVLREAMSLGKACVATSVNGVPELFLDDRAGLMVEKHSPTAIFDGIEKVLGDAQLRSRYERNALERIKEDFMEEVMIDRLESLFESYLYRKRDSVNSETGTTETIIKQVEK